LKRQGPTRRTNKEQRGAPGRLLAVVSTRRPGHIYSLHETRIFGGPPDGSHYFGSIVIAVDRHFNVDRDIDQVPIGKRGEDWGNA
jgi:hypothetical protein